MPTAKLIPARLIKLIVLPNISKIMKELMILKGIEIPIMSVDLIDLRKIYRINIARIAPKIKFSFTADIEESMYVVSE